MTSIMQALGAGHSAQRILRYLSQQNPRLAQQISTALNAGHSVDHVINFLSRSEKKLGNLFPEKRKDERSSNLYKTAQTSVHPALKGAATLAGTTAAIAGGAYALSRAVPKILQAGLPGALNPQASTAQTPNLQPNSGANGQNLLAKSNQSQAANQSQPQVSSNILQQVEQPEGISNPKEFLEKLGVKDKVDELLKSGNSAEQVSAVLGMQGGAGKVRGKIDPQLMQAIDAYSKEKLRDEAMQPEGSQPILKKEEQKTPPIDNLKIGDQFRTRRGETATLTKLNDKTFEYTTDKGGIRSGPIESLEYELEKGKPIEKSDFVATPSGIGEVVALRNGQALVDINGKLSKVSIDDLEQEPEEIKRAEIVIKPEDIPEKLRSAALGFVSVPKSRRDIDIMFGPSGKFYRYYRKDGKPVSEDIIEKLREGQTMPISSGDTYMGAFDASVADSRGTVAYHDLKSKAQSKEAVEKGVMRKGAQVKEEADPSKEFWYEELESPFIHGFIDEFLKTLTKRSREYQKAKKTKK